MAKIEIENKRVAIVGNAISLLDLNYGNDIDDHDVVFRINNTPLFHRHSTGTKIDVWALNDRVQFEKRLHTRAERPLELYLKHAENKIVLDLAMHNNRQGGIFWGDDKEEQSVEIKQKILRQVGNPSCGITLIAIIASLNPSAVGIYGFDWKRSPTFEAESDFQYIIEKEDKHGQKIYRYDQQYRHNYDREEEYIRNNYLTMENWRLYNGQNT